MQVRRSLGKVFQRQVVDYLMSENDYGTGTGNLLRMPYTLVDTTSGAVGLTVPLASLIKTGVYRVKNIGNNPLTLNRSGSDTIDGATSYVLSGLMDWAVLYTNGLNWYIIG